MYKQLSRPVINAADGGNKAPARIIEIVKIPKSGTSAEVSGLVTSGPVTDKKVIARIQIAENL
ncbi:MAG TPA: hypothetical protein VGD98_19420 [Ktedonobacteraceae bacterium]